MWSTLVRHPVENECNILELVGNASIINHLISVPISKEAEEAVVASSFGLQADGSMDLTMNRVELLAGEAKTGWLDRV